MWQDYSDNSELTLVFGHVSAQIRQMTTSPETWGIISHPYTAQVITGTRDEAKQVAETWLRNLLETALQNMPPTK